MDRERALALLREFDLGAVVATSYQNLTYLSEVYVYTQRVAPTRMSAIVLTAAGDAVYIFCGIEESLIRDKTWIKDLRGYIEFAEDPMDMLAACLREQKLDGMRVGVERGLLGADHVANIERHGAKAKYVDNGEYFKKLRMIKTREEIDLLSRAAVITRKAVEAAFAATRAGDREKQVANKIMYHMLDMGCDETSFITVATGKNGCSSHGRRYSA